MGKRTIGGAIHSGNEDLIPKTVLPVKNSKGEIANFTLKVNGKMYRCACGCNVFYKPDASIPSEYKCNCCGQTFETA